MVASTILKTLFYLTSLLAVTANAAPTQDLHTSDFLPRGYTEVPVEWEVRAFPDGEVLHLNGSAEKVHGELLALNPDFDSDFAVSDEEEEEEERSLEARGSCGEDWSLVRCDTDRNYAQRKDIEDGIKYLRKVGGKPSLPAGPAKCGRVSCSWGSGIWWCNDYKKPWSLGSYDSIANGARCIINECETITSTVTGQAFAKGSKWNVMVHNAQEHC